jgi:hypothetical protein
MIFGFTSKAAVFFLATGICAAQSLSFTCADATDARCVNGSTPTITFTQSEGVIVDFGIQLNAMVSGTWTLGAIPQICPPSPAYGQPGVQVWNASTGAQITASIAANTEIAVTPQNNGAYATFQCAPGTYRFQVPWTNGGATVNINVNVVIVLRHAAPIFFNGFGIPDYQMNTLHGATQQAITPPNGYTYDYNSIACTPSCDPRVTPPVALGGSWTDEFGNTDTVVGGGNGIACTVQEAGKVPISLNNTYVICGDPSGGDHIYYADGTGLYCNITASGVGTGADYYWSPFADNVIYFVGGNGVFGSSSGAGVIYKITLTGSGGGCTSASSYDFSAYGRYNGGSGGHVSGTRDGWIPFNTIKDYSMNVTISGTALTWVSGTAIDDDLVGQNLDASGGGFYLGASVVSVNLGAHTAVLSATPSCTGACSISFKVPYQWGMMKDQGSGTAYTIIAGDVQTNPVQHINDQTLGNGGPGPFPSEDLDGNIWSAGAASDGTMAFSMYFNPSTDTSQHFTTGPPFWGGIYNRTCNTNAASNVPVLQQCDVGPHQATMMMSNGSGWQFVAGQPYGGRAQGGVQYRHVANLSTSTDTLTPIFSANYSTELGPAEGTYSGGITGEWNVSTTWNLLTGTPIGYAISGCTNATPTTCTLVATGATAGTLSAADSAALLASGARVSNISVCTGLNGVQAVSSAASGASTITFSTAGCPGAFSGSGPATYGYIMADLETPGSVSIIDYTGGDSDVIRVCRDNVLCYKVGHTRSLQITDALADTYYGIPRANISMDGTKVVFATNFGMPSQWRVVSTPLPFSAGGAGVTPNCLDRTHCVAASTTSASITLSVTTPTTGPAIFELGTSQRWTDTEVASDPSGACSTVREAVLSMASGDPFTCAGFNSYAWAAGDPDPNYQVQIVPAGAASKSVTFSGLSAGTTYYWRAIADFKTGAWGSAVPSGAANSVLDGRLRGTLH